MVETDSMIRMLEAAITQAPVIAVLIWYVVALRNENRELREENEILKKAAAYFAKNQK